MLVLMCFGGPSSSGFGRKGLGRHGLFPFRLLLLPGPARIVDLGFRVLGFRV